MWLAIGKCILKNTSTMELIDGKKVSADIKREIAAEVEKLLPPVDVVPILPPSLWGMTEVVRHMWPIKLSLVLNVGLFHRFCVLKMIVTEAVA